MIRNLTHWDPLSWSLAWSAGLGLALAGLNRLRR